MASYQKRFALMELQPGQVNWSGVPVRVFPGAIRLWIWTAFAHGSEFVTTYRFRQPRFGIELFHHGLIGTDGVTPSVGGREFCRVITEMRRLDLSRVPAFADEPLDARKTVGLVLDFDQLWNYLTLPQARRWDQKRWLITWHAALSRMGLRVMILRPGMDWPAQLPVVVAPGVQMIDDDLLGRMKTYAGGGGNLVLTCRTGLMDRTGQLWEGPTAAPILPMIGATIDGYDGLREGRFGKIKFNSREYAWGVWGDQVVPNPGTQVLATYEDQFYAGAPAITRNKLGKGTVSYFGVFSEPPLVEDFIESLAGSIGADRLGSKALPPRVRVLRRGPYWIALNYQDRPVGTPAPTGARFVIGSAQLAAADVAVWEE
jgi:beta-galactosidase